MDKAEAIKMLDHQILELKKFPYATFEQWQQKKHVEVFDVESSTGQYYRIEAQAILENTSKFNGNIRVIATIDDSHLYSTTKTLPVFKQFIIAPNNSIVAG
jgi:hypothetical protein